MRTASSRPLFKKSARVLFLLLLAQLACTPSGCDSTIDFSQPDTCTAAHGVCYGIFGCPTGQAANTSYQCGGFLGGDCCFPDPNPTCAETSGRCFVASSCDGQTFTLPTTGTCESGSVCCAPFVTPIPDAGKDAAPPVGECSGQACGFGCFCEPTEIADSGADAALDGAADASPAFGGTCTCTPPVAGEDVDSGIVTCGFISCALGCRCADAIESRCTCEAEPPDAATD